MTKLGKQGNIRMSKMGLEYQMRSRKLFTIKKCKERLKKNLQENWKISGKREIHKIKLLNKKSPKKFHKKAHYKARINNHKILILNSKMKAQKQKKQNSKNKFKIKKLNKHKISQN